MHADHRKEFLVIWSFSMTALFNIRALINGSPIVSQLITWFPFLSLILLHFSAQNKIFNFLIRDDLNCTSCLQMQIIIAIYEERMFCSHELWNDQ